MQPCATEYTYQVGDKTDKIETGRLMNTIAGALNATYTINVIFCECEKEKLCPLAMLV